LNRQPSDYKPDRHYKLSISHCDSQYFIAQKGAFRRVLDGQTAVHRGAMISKAARSQGGVDLEGFEVPAITKVIASYRAKKKTAER
jgi:hypothetical protein